MLSVLVPNRSRQVRLFCWCGMKNHHDSVTHFFPQLSAPETPGEDQTWRGWWSSSASLRRSRWCTSFVTARLGNFLRISEYDENIYSKKNMESQKVVGIHLLVLRECSGMIQSIPSNFIIATPSNPSSNPEIPQMTRWPRAIHFVIAKGTQRGNKKWWVYVDSIKTWWWNFLDMYTYSIYIYILYIYIIHTYYIYIYILYILYIYIMYIYYIYIIHIYIYYIMYILYMYILYVYIYNIHILTFPMQHSCQELGLRILNLAGHEGGQCRIRWYTKKTNSKL